MKVNTEAIDGMAQAVSLANDNINRSFDLLKKQGTALETSWKSKAGSKAVTMMHDLFKGNEERSAVLENYYVFLQQQANPGFIASETQNTKLADKFL